MEKGGFAMRRQQLSGILIVLAIVTLLGAGCGPTPAEPTQAPEPTAPPAVPTEAPAPTEAAPAPTEIAAAPTEVPTQLPAAPTLTPAPEGPIPGGAVSLAFQEDPNSLDAILGYNLPAWQSLMNLYRGLMIYEGDRAVPDMAADWPEISGDGLVYTFTIKPGIKFHNGREVVAEDFRYSLNRVLDPEWASWANYYLLSIEGAQSVIDGEAEEATGIEVLDDHTLRFTLTAPDMTFMNVLALPNNWVVPKEEVEKWGAEFEMHPVGTGPFMLKEFIPGEKAVFVRNPDYYVDDQPYIDETTMYFGIEPSTALLRMEKGEVDVLFGDMIPAADFPRLISDPQYDEWLFEEPSMYTWWLGLNNKMAPLDNPALRQALNLAIDKEKIAKLTGGKGKPLYGIYPSTAPGFDPNFKPYDYDPEAAKAKLAEAGLADGLELEMLIGEDPLTVTEAQAIQQDLAQIGVTVTIKQVSDTVAYDMIVAGEGQIYINSWYMIQPDPADLVNNLYMCDAGSNQDFYCNPKVDVLAIQALGEQDREKRMQLYREIETILMDDAVHVPLINGISFYMHNPRIQGFYSRSEYGPFFERMWIQP
jgi:ABC-type transport system substrate-binding protein